MAGFKSFEIKTHAANRERLTVDKIAFFQKEGVYYVGFVMSECRVGNYWVYSMEGCVEAANRFNHPPMRPAFVPTALAA